MNKGKPRGSLWWWWGWWGGRGEAALPRRAEIRNIGGRDNGKGHTGTEQSPYLHLTSEALRSLFL